MVTFIGIKLKRKEVDINFFLIKQITQITFQISSTKPCNSLNLTMLLVFPIELLPPLLLL